MSTQQDIYAASSESRTPMLNKENYVPWSSRLLRYAKSTPNGKLIHNPILNGPYVRKMIPEPGEANREITEKKAKLFKEWQRFTSNEGESIESYYHRFLKLMNDLKRNKHFPEKIASNLKFLNNLQPKWSRHVTIVHQTKDLHTTDYTQLYDFMKYNQKEIQDPLALMANSNNPDVLPVPHQDQSSFNQNYLQQPMKNPEDIIDPTTVMNMALTLMAKAFKLNYSTPANNNQRISLNPRNRQIAQPGMNMGQDRQKQMVGAIQNAVQNPRVQNVGNQNGLIGVQGNGNQNQTENGNLVEAHAEGNAVGQNGNQIRCYNCRGVGHYARNCTVKPRRRDAAYLQTQLLIAQKEEAGIQLQVEEYDLMATAVDLDEIEEVNANCILMANLRQASTSGTQIDSAPVYDTDGSAEIHENCDDNEIFNMFTQEEHVEQGGETVEQHPANFEETRALYESLYQNLAIEVEKVNSVDCKLKETNADLTTKLARFKNQERCFEISQEKYEKLKKCYQQSVYQEQCLSKKISPLHLSTAKFVGDFKSLANEADASLAKHKALELEIERLLKAVVSQDIMIIVQNESVVDTSNLQTELERTKERFENCIIKRRMNMLNFRMIVPVNETFHEQTNDKLTENELKQIEAGDQVIQTILLGLPEDIYATVDSCETT
nr:hypothetical protein [Tanacetum cinerariifolium]